jgi:hypothetical protein
VVAKNDLIAQLEKDARVFEKAPAGLHPPADIGFKEHGRFGEANLNFSIVSKPPDRADSVLADIDLDCFDDKLAHIALEVIPNTISKFFGQKRRTNPAQIYALRWMAIKNCRDPLPLDVNGFRPDFDPLYRISPG